MRKKIVFERGCPSCHACVKEYIEGIGVKIFVEQVVNNDPNPDEFKHMRRYPDFPLIGFLKI